MFPLDDVFMVLLELHQIKQACLQPQLYVFHKIYERREHTNYVYQL